MKIRISLFTLCALAALTTGCDEEQVLYREKSPEPIPEVPDRPASLTASGQPTNLGPAAVAGEAPAAPQTLPPPSIATFSRAAQSRPSQRRELQGVSLMFPSDYVAEQPDSAMRAAQYRVPNDGGTPGELVVFFFGAGEGGDVGGNAGRWLSQFTPSAPGQRVVQRFEGAAVGALTVSRITLEGTWNAGMMPGMGSAPAARTDWAMDAVIVEGGPEGTLFVRLTGPRDLVLRESASMEHLAATATLAGASNAATNAAPSQTAAPADAGPRDVVHGIAMALPGGWIVEEPVSRMRALQVRIPSEGRAPEHGELLAFYFGPGGGGTTRANLDRWAGQVAGGTPTERTFSVGSLNLSIIQVDGTYRPTAMGPGAPPADPQADARLVGAVIEGGPEGPLYLRFTGPRAVIEANQAAIEAMLESVSLAP